jgi:hypothetical protein
MNQGLAAARGQYVAFCNNDTILPERWASTLVGTARRCDRAGIVVPALTAARSSVTVRAEAGSRVAPLPPFSAPPGAVVYVMKTDLVQKLGAWDERYEIASGEDVDLAFTVWVNDLDIVYDERVLVDHVGKGSASRLDDWRTLWTRNRQRFFEKWIGDDAVPRLGLCDPDRFDRNRATARAVAEWMERYFGARDRPALSIAERGLRAIRRWGRAGRKRVGSRVSYWGRTAWSRMRPLLPVTVARHVRRVGKWIERILG